MERYFGEGFEDHTDHTEDEVDLVLTEQTEDIISQSTERNGNKLVC